MQPVCVFGRMWKGCRRGHRLSQPLPIPTNTCDQERGRGFYQGRTVPRVKIMLLSTLKVSKKLTEIKRMFKIPEEINH